MQTVNMTQFKQIVRHVAGDHRMPVMCWGQPGVGKSEGMHQIAAESDGLLVDIRLSQYDSVDLRGIPVPDNEEELTIWHAPATLPFKGNDRFAQHTGTIWLFLDEINSAAPAVAAVAYQLINDRRVGEHELMDNVRVVAAGNRESDRGVTNRMPTPLANRFIHVEMGISVTEVSQHFTKLGLPAVLVAFLNFRDPLVSTFDASKPDKAFATPRTWEKVGRILADTAMPDSIKNIAIMGAVGNGPGGEFLGFLKVWQSVTPLKDIIADPHGAKVPSELSMKYATAMNISGALDAKEPAKLAALHTYLKRMDEEHVILAWKMAIHRDEELLATAEFLDLAKTYRNLLHSA